MGHGPGGGLGHHRRQPGAAALGDDDPVGPGALRRADDGPQVVGVAELVADHQQGGLPPGLRRAENVLHRGVFPDGTEGDDALVGVGAAHGVQLPPVRFHHHGPGGAGLGGDVAQGLVRLALLQVDFINGRPGPQGLDDGVPPLDDAVGLGGGGSAVFHRVPSRPGGPGLKILSIRS